MSDKSSEHEVDKSHKELFEMSNSNPFCCFTNDWMISSDNHQGGIGSLNDSIKQCLLDFGIFPDQMEIGGLTSHQNMSIFIQSEADYESALVAIIPDHSSVEFHTPSNNIMIDPNVLKLRIQTANDDDVTDPKGTIRLNNNNNNGSRCNNCGTSETTLWRRCEGKLMCNPCALYAKLHGTPRPLHLLGGCIKRRRRKQQSSRSC